MFLSNWLVFKIVLAALGRTDYPVAGDLELKYDNANKLTLSGGSLKYVDDVTLWSTIGTETTSYDIIESLHLDASNEQFLLADDRDTNTQLGYGCAIDGDYMIGGAPQDDQAGSGAGAAYIFKKMGTSWIQTAKLVVSDAASNDQAAEYVNISGDYAIIGVYTKSSSRGAIYIFKRDTGAETWTEQSKLTTSDGSSNHYFGWGVSISSDYAISGTRANGGGKAYIYKRSGTSWGDETIITGNDTGGSHNFGTSVAIKGDYAVVGAKNGDSSVTGSGAAYVFKRSGTSWTQQVKLVASDPVQYDGFGHAVDIDGDYIAVGAAEKHSSSHADVGAIYIFKKDAGAETWTEQAKLMASDAGANDYLTNWGGLSISGDTVVAGANYHDTDVSSAGAAYVWKRSGTTWTEVKKLTAGNHITTDGRFGISVGISGNTIVVGAGYEDVDGVEHAGVLHVYNPQKITNYYINEIGKYSVDANIAGLNYKTNEVDVTSLNIPEKVVQVSSGGNVSMALTEDGSVYTWGDDLAGNLGQGTTNSDVNIPVKVKGVGGSGFLSNITKISCGGYHSMALASDGTLYAWGMNGQGQLGDNSTTDRNTPVKVSYSGDPVSNISAGFNHSALTTTTGKVYCWGTNGSGQVGDNSTTQRNTPTQVVGVGNVGTLAGIRDVTCGDNFTLAIKDSDGSVYGWGKQQYGMIGNGQNSSSTSTPTSVILAGGSAVTGITQISGGGDFSLYLKSDGTVYSAGYGASGQLGDGSTGNNDTGLVQVPGVGGSGYLTGITQIAASESSSLALKSDGTMYSWGNNTDGQNGLGTVGGTNPNTPVEITALTGVDSINNDGKGYTFIASKSDGSVYCWGRGDAGQLGDGTNTADQGTPTQVLPGAGPSLDGKFNLFTSPSLVFDNYNKLSINHGLSSVSSKLFLGLNVYDIGTLTSDLTIETPGVYKSLTYDTTSNAAYFNKTTVSAVASTMAGFELTNTLYGTVQSGHTHGLSQGGFGTRCILNGDGTRLLVTDPLNHPHGRGRAYIYHWENGSWALKQTWNNPAGNNQRFADTACMNEDGTRIFLQFCADSHVYVYEYASGAWETSNSGTHTISAGSGMTQEKCGVSCNKAGDVVIIGYGHGDKAYIYRRASATSWSQDSGGHLTKGRGCAINGDGTRAFVGHSDATVHVTDWNGSTWSALSEIINESYNGWPGLIETDSAGETLVIVTGQSGTNADESGIYERASNGTWSRAQGISSYSSIYGSRSQSISYDGTMVLVGNNNYDSDKGRAYLWQKSGGTWSLTKTYDNPDPSPVQYDYFGAGCGIARETKDKIVIGMLGDDDAGTDYGSVWTYTNAIPDFISFDMFTKLKLSGITSPASKIHALPTGAQSTTTYDIGTATNMYIEDTGTYTAEMKGSSAFAIDSNVVSTVTTRSFPESSHRFKLEDGTITDDNDSSQTFSSGGSFEAGVLRNDSKTSLKVTPGINKNFTLPSALSDWCVNMWVFIPYITSYGSSNSNDIPSDFSSYTTTFGWNWHAIWTYHMSDGKEFQMRTHHNWILHERSSGSASSDTNNWDWKVNSSIGSSSLQQIHGGNNSDNNIWPEAWHHIACEYKSATGKLTFYIDGNASTLTGTFSTGCSLSGFTLGDNSVHNAHTHNGSSYGSPYPFLYFSDIVINSSYDSAVYTSTKGTYKHFLPIPNPLGVRQLRGEGSESSVAYTGGGPKLKFDGFNKYTFTGADTGSTYKLKYLSNTYDLGTTSTIYIKDAGTYSGEIKGATNFGLSSNVSGTVSEPTISGPVSIEWASLNYSNFDGSGGKAATGTGGTLVLNGTWNTSVTSPYVGTAIDITGASAADHNFKYTIPFKPKSQSFELSFKASQPSSGTTFQVYLGYLTLNWSMAQGWNTSGDSRQKVVNLYAPAGGTIYLAGMTGQSLDQSSYTYDSTKPFVITSDTSTLKIEHNGNSKSIDLTATHEDSSGGTVADPEYYLWMAFDENSSNAVYNLSDVTYSVGGEVIKAFPTLSFDGYNKLSFSNIAPTTSNVTFDGNTYSIGTATDIYIENAGTYEAESKSASAFALTSNVVSSLSNPPEFSSTPSVDVTWQAGSGGSETFRSSEILGTGDGTYKVVFEHGAPLDDSNDLHWGFVIMCNGKNDLGSSRGSADSKYYYIDFYLTESFFEHRYYGGSGGSGGSGFTPVVYPTIESGYQWTDANKTQVEKTSTSKNPTKGDHANGRVYMKVVIDSTKKSENKEVELQFYEDSAFTSKFVSLWMGNASSHSAMNSDYQPTPTGVNRIKVWHWQQRNQPQIMKIYQPNTLPDLTFDGYKHVLKNFTPTSSTLKYESNTYDIGTATNVYINDVGTYNIEAKNASTFVLASNVSSGTIKTVTPVITGGYFFTHALTYDGKLYAWGENNNGELGVGDTTDRNVPILCTGITQGEVVSIWEQNKRGQSRWAKTRDGRIWVTGDHDQYCLPGSSSDYTTFTDVSLQFGDHTQTSNSVVWASCGERATHVLMENGDVWSFGDDSGSAGILGQGSSPTNDRTPRKLNVSNITKMASGGDLVIALDSSGNVLMWGRTETGSSSADWGPYDVPTNIMAVGTDDLTTLLAVDSETVTDVYCSYYSMFVLTNKGTVYGTGKNGSGQLGQGNTTSKDSSDGWVKIDYFTTKNITVNKLYVGALQGHVFADTSDGWYCWGKNGSGNLALGDTTKKKTPVKWTHVSNIKVFGTGAETLYAITEDGKYHAWGSAANGARGDTASSGNISYPKYIIHLPNILAPSFEFDGYDKVSCYDPELLRKVSFQSFTYNGLTCKEMQVLTQYSGTWYAWSWEFIEGANGDFDSYNRPVTDGGADTRGQANEWYKGAHDWRILRTSNGYKLEKVNYQSGTWGNPSGGFHIQTADTYQPDENGIVIIPFNWSSHTGVMFKEPLYKNGVDFSTKFTKGTTTHDAGEASIVTVSDPGTYDAQLNKGDFVIKSATVPSTTSTGLYTWAFHHGNFDNAYGDGDILTARDNGRFYADTPVFTGDIGTITPTVDAYPVTYTFPFTSAYPVAGDYSQISSFTDGDTGSGGTTIANGYMTFEGNNDTNDRMPKWETSLSHTEYSVGFDAYFIRSSLSSGDAIFFGGQESSGRFELKYVPADHKLSISHARDGHGMTTTAGTTVLADTTWYNIKVVFKHTSSVKVYIDNVLEIDHALTGSNWSSPSINSWYFGAKTNSNYSIGGMRMKNFDVYEGLWPVTKDISKTTYTFAPPSGGLTANVLMVAGGGGGGGRYSCGGGGAGGLVYTAGTSLAQGATKTIVVGNGESGGVGDSENGFNGKDTTFTGLTSAVGGGAGGTQGNAGATGGSGGGGGGQTGNGAGGSATASQGHAGGTGSNVGNWGGGGGGGAGAAGSNGGNAIGGNSGAGKFFGTGSSDTNFGDEYGEGGWFASGGGGGTYGSTFEMGFPGRGGGGYGQGYSGYAAKGGSTHGMVHTGGGGGGSGTVDRDGHPGHAGNGAGYVTAHGGRGGSGIVLIQTNVAPPNGANTAVVQVGNPRRRCLLFETHAVDFMGSEVNRFSIIDGLSMPTYRLPTHWYGDPISAGGYEVPTTQGSFSVQKRADGSTSNVWYQTSYHYFADYGTKMAQTADAIFMPVEAQRYNVLLGIGANSTHDIQLEMAADGTAKLYYGNGSNHLASGTTKCFTVGKWHHIALTVDSEHNAVGYVNGYPVVSTTYLNNPDLVSRTGNLHMRTGVNITFRKFLLYEVSTYNFHMTPKQVLQRAAEVGLGPKLEYDGLNTLKILNTEPGSTVRLFTSNVADTSNVFIVADPADNEYTIPEPGKYYAEIKGTDTFTITRTLDVSGTFPLYQYPPIATGTKSSLTVSTSADTWSTWTMLNAAHGNGQYQAKTSHSTNAPGGTTACAAGLFTNLAKIDTINEDGTTHYGFLHTSTISNFDITVQLPSAKIIRKYVLYPADTNAPVSTPGGSVDPTLPGNGSEENTRRPKSWVLKGSNNDSDWTTIHTVTDKPPSIYGDVHTISSPASYQYYMLSISANNGSSSTMQLAEWQLWGDA